MFSYLFHPEGACLTRPVQPLSQFAPLHVAPFYSGREQGIAFPKHAASLLEGLSLQFSIGCILPGGEGSVAKDRILLLVTSWFSGRKSKKGCSSFGSPYPSWEMAESLLGLLRERAEASWVWDSAPALSVTKCVIGNFIVLFWQKWGWYLPHQVGMGMKWNNLIENSLLKPDIQVSAQLMLG